MKLLILLVVLITVFKANCRDDTIARPDGALNPDFTDELQYYNQNESEPLDLTYDVDHQLKNDVNEKNQIELRGKAEKKCCQKMMKMLGVVDGKVDSLEDVNSNQNTKLDLIIDKLGNLSKKQDADCPTGFTQNGANCYWFSRNKGEKASWTVAKQKCDALGTQIKKNVHLAELGTKGNCGSDIWLMETLSATRERAWVGASLKNNQKWVWEYSGRTLELNFPFWAPSEPNASGAVCVNAWPHGNKNRDYLADDGCTNSFYYVCQIFD